MYIRVVNIFLNWVMIKKRFTKFCVKCKQEEIQAFPESSVPVKPFVSQNGIKQ